MKKENTIEYLKIFPKKDNVNHISAKATKINLSLDDDADIKRLVATEKIEDISLDKNKNKGKPLHFTDLVQLVILNVQTKEEKRTLYITTWDLEENIEYSMT